VIFILYFYIASVQDFLGFKFTDEALYGTFFVRPSCDPKQLLVPIQQSVIEAWMRCRKVFFCKTLIARLLQLLQALNIQYTGLRGALIRRSFSRPFRWVGEKNCGDSDMAEKDGRP
jgi:hypothetical protein